MRNWIMAGVCILGLGAVASVVAPIEVTLSQADGTTFVAVPRGDEFCNWMETQDGYTIVAHQGNWHYARLDGDRLVPTDISVEDLDGRDAASLPRHLHPPVDPESLRNYVPRQLGVGLDAPFSQNLVVIVVDFADINLTYTNASFRTLVFGTSASVADFYDEISYGDFTLSPAAESSGASNNGIIGVTLASNHPNFGSTTGGSACRTLVQNAITAADPYIFFNNFDANGDGYVTADELSVLLIIAGYENSYGGSSSLTPNIWAHRGSFTIGTFDGVNLRDYAMVGECHATSVGDKHQATIGIMAHELGHLMLELPDLYDRDGSSAGVGDWCVMSSGNWNYTGTWPGDSPAHLSAWGKQAVQFVAPAEITGTTNNVLMASAASSSFVPLVWIDKYKYGEGFLVENRQQFRDRPGGVRRSRCHFRSVLPG